jgi:hypothetical protein
MVDRTFLFQQSKPLNLELVPIDTDNKRSTSEACANNMLGSTHDELQRERERWAKVLGAKK